MVSFFVEQNNVEKDGITILIQLLIGIYFNKCIQRNLEIRRRLTINDFSPKRRSQMVKNFIKNEK